MADITKRLQNQANEFAENTSAHGIGRINNRQRPVWYRMVWLCLTFVAMGLSMKTCVESFRLFMSSPFQMVETLEPQAQIQFPSVTFCSAFPLPVLGGEYERVRSRLDEVKSNQCYDHEIGEGITRQIGVSETLLLYSVADGNLTDIGYTASTLIASCRFNNQRCTAANFTRHVEQDLLNCYTFNTEEFAQKTSNLELMLYMSTSGQPYNYSDVLEFFTNGVYVQIHEPGSQPDPTKQGVTALPGTTSQISLQTQKTERLKAPAASNCTNDTLPDSNYRYSVNLCYQICLQKLMTNRCGCAYAGIHVEKPYGYNGNFCLHDFCNRSRITSQTECITRFLAEVDLNVNCDHCSMPPCIEYSYDYVQSMTNYFLDFPASDFAEDYLAVNNHAAIADMIEIYGDLANVPLDFISKNFARVQVIFTDLHIRKRTATLTMSAYSLFSDLGGAFGFWIGFSILTFVEVIEWLIRMCISMTPGKVKSVDEASHEETISESKLGSIDH